MTRWDDAGTPLSSLDNVPALPSLLSLEAVACGLVHLGANVGHRWPRLEALDVNRNQLTSLDDLAGSPPAGLGRLIVHDNRLRDAGRLLRALRAVGPAMLELDLRDNPITRAAGDARDSYRAAIVHAVNTPTLAVLDGMAVTTAERERALRRRSTLAPRGYDNNSGAGRADDAVPTALFGLPAGVLLGSAPAPPRRTCGRAGKAPRDCRRPLQSPAFRGPWAVDATGARRWQLAGSDLDTSSATPSLASSRRASAGLTVPAPAETAAADVGAAIPADSGAAVPASGEGGAPASSGHGSAVLRSQARRRAATLFNALAAVGRAAVGSETRTDGWLVVRRLSLSPARHRPRSRADRAHARTHPWSQRARGECLQDLPNRSGEFGAVAELVAASSTAQQYGVPSVRPLTCGVRCLRWTILLNAQIRA